MTDDIQTNGSDIHLAIIPDGNRRFARKNGMPVWWGHKEGATKLREIIDWCLEYPEIKMISIFALSTENLRRSEKEITELWNLFKKQFNEMKKDKKLKEKQIKINIVGNEEVWRSDVKQAAEDAMKATTNFSRKIINILLAYSGKFELINAIEKIMAKGIHSTKFTEDLFNRMLLVSKPVDFLIRTGDQQRLSGFLIYQCDYANIYFEKKMFPEITKKDFNKWMVWYKQQVNKFGI